MMETAQAERRCIIGEDDALRRALKRRERIGELVSPYRNLYAETAYWNALTKEERSRHVIRGLAKLHPQWVFAGVSAACIYEVEHSHTLHNGAVFIASRAGSHKDNRRLVRIQTSKPSPRLWNGANLVSAEHMLVDCGERFSFAEALPLFDSALRKRIASKQSVLSLSEQMLPDPSGIRRLLSYADAASENGGESLMRALIHENLFAAPLTQVEFDNPDNPHMPYRVDFCWKLADGRILVAEFDGMAKYADGANANRASIQAKLEYERRRESALRARGVTAIAHVFYEDLMTPARLVSKLSNIGVPRLR